MIKKINRNFIQPLWDCMHGRSCYGRCCAFCDYCDSPECPHYTESYPSHPCPTNHIQVRTPAPEMGEGWYSVTYVDCKPFWVGR